MKLYQSVKPVSYLKSHISEIIRQIGEDHEPYIITHNGEAKAVVQDIKSYEETQESLAMLKILALSSASISRGDFKLAVEAFDDLDKQFKL